MLTANDREIIGRLREQLDACRAEKHFAWRALGVFQEHLIVAGQQSTIQTMADLLGELATIRLVLNGVYSVEDADRLRRDTD